MRERVESLLFVSSRESGGIGSASNDEGRRRDVRSNQRRILNDLKPSLRAVSEVTEVGSGRKGKEGER